MVLYYDSIPRGMRLKNQAALKKGQADRAWAPRQEEFLNQRM
jgi:hypothetical protein